MSEEMRNLINAFGALGETCGLLRDSFMKNGFTRAEAIDLCKTYVQTALSNAGNKPGTDA